ncbi:hypothetical protein [Agrobacterium tumefaciens]|uniref:hypothetical protein n=1 Tax=Agrobacterium tumefaciens TaxID=358 RepID=UPI0021FCC6F0|nr:hypothetical protein [Agrobacterium tumefaciens]MEA1844791.1 hypothetical protein [Agrobacterium tumefaciens]UXU09039.1 hypothetical protein FY128_26930 [Agrobacterium tumefaciens]
MIRSLCISAMIVIALPLPAFSQTPLALAGVEREIKAELSKIQALEKTWPRVEKKYQGAVTRYEKAARLVRKCQRGPWRVLFKNTFKDLDSARTKLEEARAAVNAANNAATKAMKSQNRSLRLLEVSYAGKARDTAYFEKMNTLLDNLTTNYAAVLTEIVVPGYDKYVDGMDAVSESYTYAAEDCNRPLPFSPLRDLFDKVLEIVVGKISVANSAATAILELVPDKFKKT